MKFFKQHGLNHIWAQPNLIVPKLKNIDENYRLAFDTLKNPDFNQEVEATIERPNSDDLFGASSGNDEEPDATYSPPKKKNKKVNNFKRLTFSHT